jgi:hypothetical protein
MKKKMEKLQTQISRQTAVLTKTLTEQFTNIKKRSRRPYIMQV